MGVVKYSRKVSLKSLRRKAHFGRISEQFFGVLCPRLFFGIKVNRASYGFAHISHASWSVQMNVRHSGPKRTLTHKGTSDSVPGTVSVSVRTTVRTTQTAQKRYMLTPSISSLSA